MKIEGEDKREMEKKFLRLVVKEDVYLYWKIGLDFFGYEIMMGVLRKRKEGAGINYKEMEKWLE